MTKVFSQHTCEKHFMSKHIRDDAGQFVVKIPFSDTRHIFGDSSKMVLNETRFCNLIRQTYNNFLDEYKHLRHTKLKFRQKIIICGRSSYTK